MPKNYTQGTQTVPLKMVGGNYFGRDTKISTEQTFNMFVSDNWLVSFAGYKKIKDLHNNGTGRGIYSSERLGKMIACIDNKIFLIDSSFFSQQIATIETYVGDVFIAENNANQIAITDKSNIYILDLSASTFTKATIDFLPAHISFQDGYFIAAVQDKPQWRLSELNNGLSFPASAAYVGAIQTKPTNARACIPIPSKENQLFVFGDTVAQHWVDTGAQLFPYNKTSSFNIDYGCINQATVGIGDNFVVWLGYNEKSGLAIMASSGGPAEQISNDGLNYFLSKLAAPEKTYGSMFKLDGHVFYMLTAYDPEDNVTILYDFNSRQFYWLTDQNMDYHIAKKIIQFDENLYFVSNKDPGLYELSSDYYDLDGQDVAKVRIPPPFRLSDQSQFVVNRLGFTIDQGESNNPMRIDLSLSTDGGCHWGSSKGFWLKKIPYKRNKFMAWNLGFANDFVPQFRFYGKGRFLLTDGSIEYYQ